MKITARNLVIILLFLIITTAVTGARATLEAKNEDPSAYELARKSIVFICAPNGSTGTEPKVAGTGFFVGLCFEEDLGKPNPRAVKFVVTNKHVIGDLSCIFLKMNRKDGSGVELFKLELVRSGENQNVFTSSRPEVDLAVFAVPDIQNTDPLIFDYSMIADRKRMTALKVEAGTEIFTAGFYLAYGGFKQNIPMIRSGRFALISDESWLFTGAGQPLGDAYIGELGITFGASGSPVLLQPLQMRQTQNSPFQTRYVGPMLIGIIKAFPNLPTGTAAEAARSSYGLAIMEPAENLKEILKPIGLMLTKQGYKFNCFSEKTNPDSR